MFMNEIFKVSIPVLGILILSNFIFRGTIMFFVYILGAIYVMLMLHIFIAEKDPPDRADIVFDVYPVRWDTVVDAIPLNNVIRSNKHTDVHDHHIQQSLRESIILLDKWYKTVPETECQSQKDTYYSIKEYLFNEYQDELDKKERAYSTLRHIEKINGCLALETGLIREGEILTMVWHRINSPVNENVQNELKNNLLDQLADSSIAVDSPYCLVGRITRMVQTLQSLDAEGLVDIKTFDIIVKEVQHKIPVLRDEFFADHPNLLESYENNQDDEAVAEQLIQYVKKQLYKDYPDTAKIREMIDINVDELN